MLSRIALAPSTLLLIGAIWIAGRASEALQNIGIDFVQFWIAANHVDREASTSVYSVGGRDVILESAWRRIEAEEKPSRFLEAATFRHERSLETYSSPFLYSAFAAFANAVHFGSACPNQETDTRHIGAGSADSLQSKLQHSVSCEYETALQWFWMLCLCSSAFAFIVFGMATRSLCSSMLFGAAMLVWFNPLRSDINVGNVNQLQFGMLGVLVAILCWTYGRSALKRNRFSFRDAAAAFWFTVCLAFKPTLLWCGIMFLAPTIIRLLTPLYRQLSGHRQVTNFLAQSTVQTNHHVSLAEDYRRLVSIIVGSSLGAAVAIGLSLIWFPLHSWVDWVDAVRTMPDEFILTAIGNHSPTYLLRYSLDLPTWIMMLIPIILACVVLGTSRTLWMPSIRGYQDSAQSDAIADTDGNPIAKSTVENDIRLIAIGCQIALLTAHLVWFHYFVLSLPAFLLLLPQVTQRGLTIRHRIQTGLALFVCLFLIGVQPFDRFMHPAVTEHVIQTAVANAILLVMLAWNWPESRVEALSGNVVPDER
jgi:hypothetical protein